MTEIRHCFDLDNEIELLLADGYRVDMITPADSPREVQLSKNRAIVRLVLNRKAEQTPPQRVVPSDWITGRAGMMYRDLLPDRLGGKLIASHIRLTRGGPVPDYVHYHKIDFQLIYCLLGRIRVVYEDQGEPFWLEPGDCVLQPPEIRHRVLECEAGSEVLELSSPPEHETWVEHEITLPTANIKPHRLFSGQHFVRSIATDARWQPTNIDGVDERDLGIFKATNGTIDARVFRTSNPYLIHFFKPRPGMIALGFVVAGKERNDSESWPSLIWSGADSETIETDILRIEFLESSSIH